MIGVGDRVRLYDGEEATVRDIQCLECEMRVSHERCGRFAQIDDRRWVNVDYVEKL